MCRESGDGRYQPSKAAGNDPALRGCSRDSAIAAIITKNTVLRDKDLLRNLHIRAAAVTISSQRCMENRKKLSEGPRLFTPTCPPRGVSAAGFRSGFYGAGISGGRTARCRRCSRRVHRLEPVTPTSSRYDSLAVSSW